MKTKGIDIPMKGEARENPPSFTFSMPDELREKMKAFPQVNWSQLCRDAVTEAIAVLEDKR